MEKERIIERKRFERTEERRKSLILYLIYQYSFCYFEMIISWKDIGQWHENGTYHRKRKKENNIKTSEGFD